MTADNYDDIINMPHHVSRTRQPLDTDSRAAQFAPFAALAGYDEAIAESITQNIRDVDSSPFVYRLYIRNLIDRDI